MRRARTSLRMMWVDLSVMSNLESDVRMTNTNKRTNREDAWRRKQAPSGAGAGEIKALQMCRRAAVAHHYCSRILWRDILGCVHR